MRSLAKFVGCRFFLHRFLYLKADVEQRKLPIMQQNLSNLLKELPKTNFNRSKRLATLMKTWF